jgi:hypothetical protein
MKKLIILFLFFNILRTEAQQQKDIYSIGFITYDTLEAIALVTDTLHYTNYTPQLGELNYFDKAGNLTWVKVNVIAEKRVWHSYLSDKKYNYYNNVKQILDGFFRPLDRNIIVFTLIIKQDGQMLRIL